MINMFSLIVDQVRNRQDLFDQEGRIIQSLLNSGYLAHEADAALMLMQDFVQRRQEQLFDTNPEQYPASLRSMSREERRRFTLDAFGFISKLTHIGIISEDQREEVLGKALSIYPHRIQLEHMKSLITMILLTPSLEQEQDTDLRYRSYKGTAWN